MLFSTVVSYSFSRRSDTHQLVFNQLGWDSGLGLYDYNARYYDPYINRFISADTIVPDPTNPQQYNRYSYVLNNALRYTDPSGHSCYNPSMGGPCILSDGTGNNEGVPSSATTPSMPTSFTSSLIEFTGGDWTDAEMRAVHQGAYMLALALARAMNDLAGGAYDTIGWEVAFFAVFGGQVTFNKTGGACGGDWMLGKVRG
jgi:RHS repeat-associated protein